MIKIKTILLKNLDIKLLAFAMAIVLWFYISSEYNITAERYYDIEVRPINLSGNLSIKEIRDKVSVGIQGPQNILENISSQKIVGTVDLKNIREAGEYQIITDIVV
ncbi:MAG: CdaR family protein, partial [Atribacterota bacterium]|nr:CdaR family protein [Atribacterota bacterium]